MEDMDCCLQVTKTTTMESQDVCPTKDSIVVLFESLVDPLLPAKPTSDVPSKDRKESVAKQLHAVVLLYNYYHRREHPHLECLSLESFRSLATEMRPALLQHLTESSEVGDSEQLLEKTILDACSLSASLDAAASDLLTTLKKWPIRKVAVLLVDSEKQNCYLKNSSITQGLWSLLEKTIDKEKTIAQQLLNEEFVSQKVSFDAIKEATGVSGNDIVILERHLAYSLSEEKTTTRFYIMKCTSQVNLPETSSIEEMITCMQGPLFEKSSSEWSMKSKVDYFHVLPYASLIADWYSRREDTELVIEKEVEAVGDDIRSNENEDATKETKWSDILEIGSKATASKRSYNSNAKRLAVSINNARAGIKPTPRINNRILRGRTNETIVGLKARNAHNEMSPSTETNSNGERVVSEIEPDSVDHRETRLQGKKVVAEKLKHNAAPVSARNSNYNLEEIQTTLPSIATSLSQTARKIILSKLDKLALLQRNIEDETAQGYRDLQNIDDDLELQLKTVLESCNKAFLGRILQESSEKLVYEFNKEKLSEPTKTSCQKLDDICLENNWHLPTYRVSLSPGGFEAEVRINETRFANPTRGEERHNVKEARESAAACLLTRLRNNATPSLPERCNDAYPRRILQDSPDKSAYRSNKRVKPTKTSCQKLDDICLENNWRPPTYRVSSSDGGFEAEVRINDTGFENPTQGEERPNAEEARESAAACLLTRLDNNARESLSQMYDRQEKLFKQAKSNMGRKG